MTRISRLLVIGQIAYIAGLGAERDAVVAEIDGQIITSRDLLKAGGVPLDRLEEQLYATKRQKLDELIASRLLEREASRRDISVESLLKIEVTDKAAAVAPEEIHSVYEINKAQLNRPEAQVRDQVEAYLRNQKAAARRQELVKSLQAQAKIVTYLQPPQPFRAELSAEGPSRGPADAPVTIIEFEDFQCPFCKKAQTIMDQVLVHYKNNVKLIHRDFPIDSLHPKSRSGHEAARCAGEQGKFWEYRALLYKNGPANEAEQLNAYAAEAKLDVPAFRTCLDNGRVKATVQNDEEEGSRLGVEGTPAFFINGRLLSGAQPESAFMQVIDQELKKRAQR